MKNVIIVFNLIGVLGLGVLCVAQWRMDRQLNAEINRLEAIRLEQGAKLDEKDKSIRGQVADLDSLREHITRITSDLRETQGRLRLAEHEVGQLTSEREQLREGVKKWAAAVEARDEQARAGNERIQELAERLNETVRRFNELATNYNTTVQVLDERTRLYNELVGKYNELANQ